MKRLNKSGQFYLVATIVFVALIAGFITISDIREKPTLSQLEQIKEELEIEGQAVLETMIVNNLDREETWKSFGQDYVDTINEEIVLILVTGKKGENLAERTLNARVYEKEKDNYPIAVLLDEEDYAKVSYGDVSENFKVKQGEIFKFIIIKEEDDEVYAITN